MKLILTYIIINCFSVGLLFSQDIILEDDFKLEEVIQVGTASKEQLFQNAKDWTLRTLMSFDNLYHFDEEHRNKIIANANLTLRRRSTFFCNINEPRLNYKMTIMFKDGRYKYVIDNLFFEYLETCGEGVIRPMSVPLKDIGFGMNKRINIYDEVDQKLKLLIADLKQSMANPEPEEDW